MSLMNAALYVLMLGNQPGFDDDEWEHAMTMLEEAVNGETKDRADAQREAVEYAAGQAHQAWWSHDDQNGHVAKDWRECDEWPCRTIRQILSGQSQEWLLGILEADARDPARNRMWRYGVMHALSLVKQAQGEDVKLPAAEWCQHPNQRTGRHVICPDCGVRMDIGG